MHLIRLALLSAASSCQRYNFHLAPLASLDFLDHIALNGQLAILLTQGAFEEDSYDSIITIISVI